MGFLSGKKKTYVSSQTFNMGGPFKTRTPFLKTVVIGAVVRDEINPMFSVGNAITSSYLNGPGIKLRNYGGWLERVDYWGTLGQGRSYVAQGISADPNIIAPYLGLKEGERITVIDFKLGLPLIDDLVDQYMLENFPEFEEYLDYTEEEFAEIDFNIYAESDPDEGIVVPDDKVLVRYKGNDYLVDTLGDNAKPSIIAMYSKFKYEDEPIIHKGVLLDPPTSDEDFKLIKDTTKTSEPVYTEEVVEAIKYKNGKEEVITKSKSNTKIVKNTGVFEYELGEYNSFIYTYKETIKEDVVEEKVKLTTEDINKGIESITKKTIKRKLDTSENELKEVLKDANSVDLGTHVYIYESGSGIKELDDLFVNNTSGTSPYYPVMPIRLGKRNVGPNHWNGVYKLNKQGYRKMTGQSYDKMMRQVNESPGVGDINTGFIQIGVAMNSPDPSAREYIFMHFRHYAEIEGQVPNMKTRWEVMAEKADKGFASIQARLEYNKSRRNRNDRSFLPSRKKANNDTTVVKPPVDNRPVAPYISRGIYNSNLGRMGYYISFTWSGVYLSSGKGRYNGNLKTGGYHIENNGNKRYKTGARIRAISIGDSGVGYYASYTYTTVNEYAIICQISDDYWEKVIVYNPYHDNSIKNGKGIGTRPFDYNEGSDESACVLPMNRAAIRKMSLKNATQMAIGAKYLTFTAFKEVKQKWYQTGIFKIIMVVVVVAVSIYFAPAGAAGGGGLLGANATIGAALGLGGTAAIVAGAITNAVAGMVVSSIISKAANKLFGAKFGAILGAIANFVVANVASSMSQGMSMQEAFVGLMKADNIMSLGNAIGKGYLESKRAATMDVLQQMQQTLDSINKQLEEVNDKMESQFKNSAIIDPLYLTDVFGGFFKESSSDFVSRTLMTGSDVAEITFNLIHNFASINTESKLE